MSPKVKSNGHDPEADAVSLDNFGPREQEAFERLRELKAEAGVDSVQIQAKLGVMQKLITAVLEDKEYRQILLTAAFDNKQEAMLAADAITERKRYGVTIQPILDRVIAQCSIHADRVFRVLDAMTRYNLQSTGMTGGMPQWKSRQDKQTLMQ